MLKLALLKNKQEMDALHVQFKNGQEKYNEMRSEAAGGDEKIMVTRANRQSVW